MHQDIVNQSDQSLCSVLLVWCPSFFSELVSLEMFTAQTKPLFDRTFPKFLVEVASLAIQVWTGWS